MPGDSPIALIGLGYAGLPLALRFAETGTRVLGFDIDAAKVDRLNAGQSYILHLPAARIAAVVESKKFSATTDFARVRECEAVILCLPTPLKNGREPDLSFILNTARAIAPHLQRGTLVVLESTT